MVRECVCGSGNCSSWPTNPDLGISVCHFPPGTSKWNKIEHRLFSFYQPELARGKPLISHEVIINLIAASTTTTSLTVKSKLDTNVYPSTLN